MTTDSETIKATMTVVAAFVGLLAALIAFVNGRLNEAKTPAKKRRVLVLTLSVVDFAIFGIGVFLSISKTWGFFGTGLLWISALIASGMFLFEQKSNIRFAVLDLVFRFSVCVYFNVMFWLRMMIIAQSNEAEALQKLLERLK
jgi:hypothetical protein